MPFYHSVVTHFMLYRTGLFHTSSRVSDGVRYSSDPNSGGTSEISPEGTLVFKSIDLRQKRGRPKILFFVTDSISNPEALYESAEIRAIESYFSRFQSYAYDLNHKLVPYCPIVDLPIKTLSLKKDPALRAKIYEDLFSQMHNGTTEPISADDILIIDDALLHSLMKGLTEAAFRIDTDPEIFYLSHEGSAEELEATVKKPETMKAFSQARCVVLKSSHQDQMPHFEWILQNLSSVECLATSLHCDKKHPLELLSSRVLSQLIEYQSKNLNPPIEVTSSEPHALKYAFDLEKRMIPKNLEYLSVQDDFFRVSEYPIFKNLKEFRCDISEFYDSEYLNLKKCREVTKAWISHAPTLNFLYIGEGDLVCGDESRDMNIDIFDSDSDADLDSDFESEATQARVLEKFLDYRWIFDHTAIYSNALFSRKCKNLRFLDFSSRFKFLPDYIPPKLHYLYLKDSSPPEPDAFESSHYCITNLRCILHAASEFSRTDKSILDLNVFDYRAKRLELELKASEEIEEPTLDAMHDFLNNLIKRKEVKRIHFKIDSCSQALSDFLKSLAAEYAKKLTVDIERVIHTSRFRKNPLDFSTDDSSPLTSQYVFKGIDDQMVDPACHLQDISKVSSLVNKFKLIPAGTEPIEIRDRFTTDTTPRKKTHYQGSLFLVVIAQKLYPLPGLPHQKIQALKLPIGCFLYQNIETQQYFIKSLTTQQIHLDWLIEAMTLEKPPKDCLDFSPFSKLLLIRNEEGKFAFKTQIQWPEGFSTQQKIFMLAQWISEFKSENAKKDSEVFRKKIDHLNAIIKRKKGRCLERSLLFNVLMNVLIRLEFPKEEKIQTYNIANDLHEFVMIRFGSTNQHFYFDLGGIDLPVELENRAEATDDFGADMQDESEGPAGAGSGALVPPKEDTIPSQKISPRTLFSAEQKRIMAEFSQSLHRPEKVLTLTPDSEISQILDLSDAFDPHSQKPKNALLTLPEEGFQRTLKWIAEQPIDELFFATSLDSLRKKIYRRDSKNPTDPRFYLEDSPFKSFCEHPCAHPISHISHISHKRLIISGELLIKAPGVSAYYPLLDSVRSINDIQLPADIQLIVLMPDTALKNFREDFESRFQVRGKLDSRKVLATLADKPSSKDQKLATASSRGEDMAGQSIAMLYSESAPPSDALRINAYNFHTLFEHPEITVCGLQQHPGFLSLGFKNILIEGELSEAQTRQLSLFQSTHAGDIQFFHTAAFSNTPYLEIQEARAILFPFMISELTRGKDPDSVVTLALPELANPFVRNISQPSGDVVAELTELVARLHTPHQTLIFYGRLSPALRVLFHTMSTGTLLLAGQSISLGTGTRVIVLNENKHSLDHSLHPHDLLILPSDVKALSMASRALETPDIFDPLDPLNPLDPLDPLDHLDPVDALDDLSIFGDLKSHYCSIQEGPPDKKEMDTPWQERLHAFLEKRKEVLTLSSFDLMNPESRSVLRDAVHSAFTGQLLINGQRYCLEKGRQRVEVVGGFIPKCTQKLAQVFQSYSALPTPKVETRTLSPEEAVPTDKKALYDALLSTSPIFLTDSRRTLIYQVDLWYQESSPLYPLFIIEGPSGIGKSAVMREYLERVIPTEKLLILGPTENLVTQLDAANRKEQLVFIDELNTLREDQLEAIEALIRSRPKLRMIGTQNPISFAGRKKLSAQLLQHAAVFHLQEYKTEELMALLASTGIPSEKAELWIHAFQEEQEKNKVTFRDFLSHVRSLSKGPVMQSSGGSSSLSLVFHPCTEKAPTKETHGSKKSSKGIKRSHSPE